MMNSARRCLLPVHILDQISNCTLNLVTGTLEVSQYVFKHVLFYHLLHENIWFLSVCDYREWTTSHLTYVS